jgi:hypothetical protein
MTTSFGRRKRDDDTGSDFGGRWGRPADESGNNNGFGIFGVS